MLKGCPVGHPLEHAAEHRDSRENRRAACGRPAEAEAPTLAGAYLEDA